MATKSHTHPKSSSRDTKYNVFTLIKAGYLTKRISDTLNITKSTVRGHIRDLKDQGLIPKSCTGYYHLTYKGQQITYEEFQNLFYRGGSRTLAGLQIEDGYRNHNIFFSAEILERPVCIPSNAKKKTLSSNNDYYIINYNSGTATFHTNRVKLHIHDFTSVDIDNAGLDIVEKLNYLVKEIEDDGFKIDKYIKALTDHVAHLYHPLAIMFEPVGKTILVPGNKDGDRLVIDFSHGKPELECENVKSNREDMKKTQHFFGGLLKNSEHNAANFWEDWDELKQIKNLMKEIATKR